MFEDKTILQTLRLFFGLPEDTTDFDNEFISYLLSTLSVASNLGIDHGVIFTNLTSETPWPDLVDPELNGAFRTWVVHKIKKSFDPPKTKHHIDAFDVVVQELEQTMVLLSSYLEPIPLEVINNE